MTSLAQTPEQRRIALIAGVWFAITFIASIPLTIYLIVKGFRPSPILGPDAVAA